MLLLLALLTLTLGISPAFAARAVEHRGVVFVSLPDLLDEDFLNGTCDSWVASMRRGRSPHHLWPGDGSIVLIHGNGNEAIGIPRLYEWMIENPGWKWGRLNRFISADAEADTGTTQPATQPTTAPQFERRRGQRAPATNR